MTEPDFASELRGDYDPSQRHSRRSDSKAHSRATSTKPRLSNRLAFSRIGHGYHGFAFRIAASFRNCDGRHMMSKIAEWLVKLFPGFIKRLIPPTTDDPEANFLWRVRMMGCALANTTMLAMSMGMLVATLFFVPSTQYVSANDLKTEIAAVVQPLKTEFAALSKSVDSQQSITEGLLVESLRAQIRAAETRKCRASRARDFRESEEAQKQIDQLQDEHNRLRQRAYVAAECRTLLGEP